MTRAEFLDLTDWEIGNVLLRPTRSHKLGDPYDPVYRVQTEREQAARPKGKKYAGWKTMYFELWRARGLSEEEIEARFRAKHPRYRRSK